jgi:hypothetical protein
MDGAGVTRRRALARKSVVEAVWWPSGAWRGYGLPMTRLGGCGLDFPPAGAAAEQVLFLWIGPSHVFPTFALGFELVSLGSKVFE